MAMAAAATRGEAAAAASGTKSNPAASGSHDALSRSARKKRKWTAEEDGLLVAFVQLYGDRMDAQTAGGQPMWSKMREVMPGVLPHRDSKACRLRWNNHLRPGLRNGGLTLAEQRQVEHLHSIHGNKWALIATFLPGRSDNAIKNWWNARYGIRRSRRKRRTGGEATRVKGPLQEGQQGDQVRQTWESIHDAKEDEDEDDDEDGEDEEEEQDDSGDDVIMLERGGELGAGQHGFPAESGFSKDRSGEIFMGGSADDFPSPEPPVLLGASGACPQDRLHRLPSLYSTPVKDSASCLLQFTENLLGAGGGVAAGRFPALLPRLSIAGSTEEAPDAGTPSPITAAAASPATATGSACPGQESPAAGDAHLPLLLDIDDPQPGAGHEAPVLQQTPGATPCKAAVQGNGSATAGNALDGGTPYCAAPFSTENAPASLAFMADMPACTAGSEPGDGVAAAFSPRSAGSQSPLGRKRPGRRRRGSLGIGSPAAHQASGILQSPARGCFVVGPTGSSPGGPWLTQQAGHPGNSSPWLADGPSGAHPSFMMGAASNVISFPSSMHAVYPSLPGAVLMGPMGRQPDVHPPGVWMGPGQGVYGPTSMSGQGVYGPASMHMGGPYGLLAESAPGPACFPGLRYSASAPMLPALSPVCSSSNLTGLQSPQPEHPQGPMDPSWGIMQVPLSDGLGGRGGAWQGMELAYHSSPVQFRYQSGPGFLVSVDDGMTSVYHQMGHHAGGVMQQELLGYGGMHVPPHQLGLQLARQQQQQQLPRQRKPRAQKRLKLGEGEKDSGEESVKDNLDALGTPDQNGPAVPQSGNGLVEGGPAVNAAGEANGNAQGTGHSNGGPSQVVAEGASWNTAQDPASERKGNTGRPGEITVEGMRDGDLLVGGMAPARPGPLKSPAEEAAAKPLLSSLPKAGIARPSKAPAAFALLSTPDGASSAPTSHPAASPHGTPAATQANTASVSATVCVSTPDVVAAGTAGTGGGGGAPQPDADAGSVGNESGCDAVGGAATPSPAVEKETCTAVDAQMDGGASVALGDGAGSAALSGVWAGEARALGPSMGGASAAAYEASAVEDSANGVMDVNDVFEGLEELDPTLLEHVGLAGITPGQGGPSVHAMVSALGVLPDGTSSGQDGSLVEGSLAQPAAHAGQGKGAYAGEVGLGKAAEGLEAMEPEAEACRTAGDSAEDPVLCGLEGLSNYGLDEGEGIAEPLETPPEEQLAPPAVALDGAQRDGRNAGHAKVSSEDPVLAALELVGALCPDVVQGKVDLALGAMKLDGALCPDAGLGGLDIGEQVKQRYGSGGQCTGLSVVQQRDQETEQPRAANGDGGMGPAAPNGDGEMGPAAPNGDGEMGPAAFCKGATAPAAVPPTCDDVGALAGVVVAV